MGNIFPWCLILKNVHIEFDVIDMLKLKKSTKQTISISLKFFGKMTPLIFTQIHFT